MASNFSSLGIPLTSPEQFLILSDALSPRGEEFSCPIGRYVRWAGECGAELWFQYDHQGRLLDIQPHFSSTSAMRMGITARLPRPTDTKLDGAWQGWLDPPDEDPSTGRCLVTFEAPDFARHHDLQLPLGTAVQMAGFARRIRCYPDEVSFSTSTEIAGRIAPQAFLPAQQKVRERGETEPLQAEALICGHLLRTELRHNEATGAPFHWLLVETEGGRIDLLVDPEILLDEPTEGGVVSAVCWLSGRLLV